MSELPRPHAVVVTWFVEGQIGFLDFGYRLQALGRHYRVTLICRAVPDDPTVVPEGAQVQVLRPVGGGLLGLLSYWARAGRRVRALRADIVVHLGSQMAGLANFGLRAPQVIYWNEHPSHYLERTRMPGRWLGRLMTHLQYRGAQRAALVMPIGEAHRGDLIDHGCRIERLALIPMGVADAFVAPVGGRPDRTDGPLRLIYAGAVHVDRGRDLMIDALAEARRRGCPVQLTLIGADPIQAQACRERSLRHGLSDEVRVSPRIPGDQIPAHLAQADFGICVWADKPYWRFNPPTKLFEYLVAGLPVLVSDIRTHTAYVRDGEQGYVFAYEVQALADALCRAWAARARWPDLRRAASVSGAPYRWSEIEPRFLGALQTLSA